MTSDHPASQSPDKSPGRVPSVSEFSLVKVLSTGEAFMANNQDDVAERLFHVALSRKPWSIRAHAGLGMIELKRGNYEQAAERFRKVLVWHPDMETGASNIANTFAKMDRPEDATRWYRSATWIDPENPALKISLGISYMRTGRWDDGFVLYDLREDKRRLVASTGERHIWNGDQPIDGKTVMVAGEQGFGDHINFARFCKPLKDLGARIVFYTRPELKELLERIPFIDEVVTHGNTIRSDFSVMAMSLPGILGTQPDSVPLREGYIPALKTGRADGASGQRPFRVAIAWRGNPDNSRDPIRSCPFEDFAVLLRQFPGVEFYCLPWDYDSITGEAPPNLRPMEGSFAGFHETADRLCEYDLVISVDTSLVHLAGAIGHPVWVLIGRQPDWRWLTHGESGIWYDSLKIFRSSSGWPDLIEKVSEQLGQAVQAGVSDTLGD